MGGNAGMTRLIAMDHTHCFTCGRDLDQKLAHIDRVKDERLYGLFPAFKAFVRQSAVESAVARLRELQRNDVTMMVGQIPNAWGVHRGGKDALIDLIYHRAEFVADTILASIAKKCWPNHLFDHRE